MSKTLLSINSDIFRVEEFGDTIPLKVKELRQILSGLPGDMDTDVSDIHIDHDGISLSARTLCIHGNKLVSTDESPDVEEVYKFATLKLDSGKVVRLAFREDGGRVEVVAVDKRGALIRDNPHLLAFMTDGYICRASNINQDLGFRVTGERNEILTL